MSSREFNFEDIPPCPELHPSIEEFSDFSSYVESVEKQYSGDFGMVKIIPPEKWCARSSDYEGTIDSKMILGPIEQNPQGKGGIYECIHLMKKSIPFSEFKKKSLHYDKFTEGLSPEKVERLFWQNISFSPPLYGSDMEMSLFDDGVKWNLKELHTVLNDGLSTPLHGVNTPYLYIGSWKTLFAWHKEDLDLGAINYLHYGKPKFWYTIAKSDSAKLENVAKSHFQDNFSKCPEFLRHKTVVINPYNLVHRYHKDIKITKTAQKQGEFIIVFNGAYHHGFNWGYNIAEAVNYASLSWLQLFPDTKLCHCSSDNVTIDERCFLDTLLKNRPDLKTRKEIKQFKQTLLNKYKHEMEEQQEQIQEEEQKMTPQKEQELKERKRERLAKKLIKQSAQFLHKNNKATKIASIKKSIVKEKSKKPKILHKSQ